MEVRAPTASFHLADDSYLMCPGINHFPCLPSLINKMELRVLILLRDVLLVRD